MLSSALQIIWPLHLQNLKLLRPTVQEEMHLKESTLFDLDLGVKATQMLLSILYIMLPIHLQGLMLLHLTFQEKMHLQEIT